MQNLLIIYPHWPPSNLAGVHRARLIANFLPRLGWHPVILTVHPDFYEEKPDTDLVKTVSESIEVHYTKAFRVTKPRLIGDIGLRAFYQLRKSALQLLSDKKIDFIWIPIPSFYTAILGRILHNKTGVPYGIDYIDPWVRDISNRRNLRSLLSLIAARILEPFALKKASLVSGVAENYFKPAIKRNFKIKEPVQVAMPYGFDPDDHTIKIENIKLPWDDIKDCKPYVYAGAFLPLSGYFINELFYSLKFMKDKGKLDPRVRFFFIGTGFYSHKPISEYAIENGVEDSVIEIRDRFPYLHILNILNASKGVLLIGSTEKHYTASKTFQVLLSGKPVLAVLHHESSAVKVFNECKANNWSVEYHETKNEADFRTEMSRVLSDFLNINSDYRPDLSKIEKYSALESAKKLVEGINLAKI
ncbi:MAG: hypothetical protein U0W24_12605 [Bacteroidales bacterium]